MRHVLKTFLTAIVCLVTHSHGQLTQGRLYASMLGEGSRDPLDNLKSIPTGAFHFLRAGGRYQNEECADMTPEKDWEVDFIVVGAGSAGSVVASRLSEISNATVFLVEAGRNESLIMDIPLTVNFQQFNPDLNWDYRTQPSDDFCLAMKDKRCNWPRGKVMGGTSVFNYMIATRGNYRDYDQWAELGNEGWSAKEVLHYFKKLENIGIPELRSDRTMHNTEGPMSINYPAWHTKLADGFLDAAREIGIPLGDYNGREQYKASYFQTTTKNGTRMSTNRAYLAPIKGRRNLYVSQNSRVSKVLFNGTDNSAYAIEFTKNGVTHTVRARKEIILSAGTIGTPQILMVSGIGPADHLEEKHIPVVKDLPVGDNLMDHIAYGGFVVLINETASILSDDIVNPMNPHLSDYLNYRQGPMSVPGGCEAIAFVNIDAPNDHSSWPNVELMFQGASMLSDESVPLSFGFTDSFWKKTYKDLEQRHSWSIFPLLMRPKSKGQIRLKDKHITTDPLIYPNYLSHPDDVRVMIGGIRAAQNISKTSAMKKFGSQFHDVHIPGCEDHTYDSDDYWECAIRHMTMTIYHHAGTAKMGPEGDPTAVVNPRLQVHGIKGLRVADASIMPEIMTGHTNIPTIMIAEKLSDMVKEDWGYPTERSLVNRRLPVLSNRRF